MVGHHAPPLGRIRYADRPRVARICLSPSGILLDVTDEARSEAEPLPIRLARSVAFLTRRIDIVALRVIRKKHVGGRFRDLPLFL